MMAGRERESIRIRGASVTPFEPRRTVQVEGGLGFCIDDLRDFECLNAVAGAVTVVAVGAVSFVERGVESSMLGEVVHVWKSCWLNKLLASL